MSGHQNKTDDFIDHHSGELLSLHEADGMDLELVLARLRESQTRLNLIADSVPALIAYIDQDHNYLYANKAFEEWFDCDVDGLVGRNVCEMVGDEAYTVIKDYLDRALAGENIFYETWIPYANGTRYVSANFKPHADEAHHVQGVFCLVHDLTSRKMAEDDLSRERTFSEAVLNSLDDELCIVDGEGTIVFANKPWNSFWHDNGGYPERDTWAGVNYFAACGSSDANDVDGTNAIVDGIRSVLRDERASFRMEYPCHSPSMKRWFELTATPLTEAPEIDDRKVVIVHSNITEKYLADEAIREANAELGESVTALHVSQSQLKAQTTDLIDLAKKETSLNQKLRHEIEVKNRFFSVLAHDLKSPFTALLGGARSLAENAVKMDSETVALYARNIHGSSGRIFKLLEQLLEWGEYQVGEDPLQPRRTEIAALIEEATGVVQDQAAEKKVTISSSISVQDVYVDPNVLSTVMRNLIVNGIKFSHPDGQLDINVERMDDSWVVFSVADQGVGIAPEIMDDVFRLDTKTTTPGTGGERGTGLGLPLCYELIEKSGGKITVENRQPAGTVFRVFLPADEAA